MPFIQSLKPNAWDVLEPLIGTIDGPPDWSSQHDHYLYSTPKKIEAETQTEVETGES